MDGPAERGSGLTGGIRTQRRAAAVAAGRVLLEGAAGAVLGAVLVWGPLDGGPGIGTWIGAAALGGLLGLARALQQAAALTGRARTARALGRGLGIFALAVMTVMVAATVIPLYRLGAIPVTGGSRLAYFDRLWQAIDIHYPYFDLKGVDWDAVYQRYRPQVAAAADDAAFLNLIRAMLAELQDGHTQLARPALSGEWYWLGLVRPIEGQAVVTRMRTGVEIPGLVPGAVILSRDGLAVPEYVESLPPWHRSGSTPQMARRNGFGLVLAIPEGGAARITYRDPQGEVREAELRGPDAGAASTGAGAASTGAGAASTGAGAAAPAAGETAPLITARRLPSGVAVLRLPTFSAGTGHDLVAEFDAALDQVLDAPGLIIDLRDNGGGDSRLADRMAGRLVERPVRYGTELYRQRLPQRGWARRMDRWLHPRGRTYTGPVALITDSGNFSTAETFIVSLHDTGRAVTVGETTAGGSGNPLTFRLPGGGQARFSTGDFRRPDGSRIEGRGLEPDVAAVWRASDIAAGRDPFLAAAEQALGAPAPLSDAH